MPFKVIFVSDTFHHHQKGVADALFEMTNGSYRFIVTSLLSDERKKMGFSCEFPPYLLDASSGSLDVCSKAQKMINDAEVVVLGSAPFSLLKKRLLEGKLTFRYSERLWKQYKHYLKTPFYILDNFRTRHCFLLCASAFAASDYNTMGAFKGRCYKWGYFPQVSENQTNSSPREETEVRIMWCSRYLGWKHPELPIFLASSLKEKGYSFLLKMYGQGQYLERTKSLAKKMKVDGQVEFIGNVANEQILQAMRNSDIFLCTSDRGEGWGVVVNEAMSNGCALVASDSIGSVPYLVKDDENGCVFRSPNRSSGFNRFCVTLDKKSLSSMFEKVESLINDPAKRIRISKNAIRTIKEKWTPRVAANNLLKLIDDLKNGRQTSVIDGPCSKA